jgi:hypothetical protein
MVSVAMPLTFRNIIWKITSLNIPIQYLIDLSFRVYPPSPTVELPVIFVFAAFGSFFFWFWKIILPNGSFFFRFSRFGRLNFRSAFNFRFVSLHLLLRWQFHRCRMAHHDLLYRLFRCYVLYRRFRYYRASRAYMLRWPLVGRCLNWLAALLWLFVARARPCWWRRRILVRWDRLKLYRFLVWLRPDWLRWSVFFI